MNMKDIADQRGQFFLQSSSITRGAFAFCLLVGLVTVVAGMSMGLEKRTWGALLFNVFFFFSIALGGSVFAAMQDVIGARWGRPIMRIHEAFTSFVPVALGFFVFFMIAIAVNIAKAHEVYSWVADHDLLHHYWGKRTWLQEPLLIFRVLFCSAIIFGLMSWQIGMKRKRDRVFAQGQDAEAKNIAEQVACKLRYWSAPLLVVYALTFSCLAFDLLKSLAPTWISTLFAGWCFAVMMQTLMAMILIWMFYLKDTQIGRVYQRQQFHDVGKMMHGFTIFFAYLTYSHIITIWYGNMPEETSYFLTRLQSPWIYFVMGAPLLCFVLPLFALIPKISKWTKAITVPIAFSILASQWVVMLLVVQPQVMKAEEFNGPWLEAGVFLGVLGVFMISVFRFGRSTPMVALADPFLRESIEAAH